MNIYAFKHTILICSILLSSCEKRLEETDYVARIGESIMTKEDIQKEVPHFLSKSEQSIVLHEIIENWAKKELLYIEAIDKGIANDKDIEKRVVNYRKSLYGKAYLDMYLSNKIFITNDEVRDYYKKNRESFIRQRPETRLAHFILKSQNEAFDVKTILLKYDGETRQNLMISYQVDVKTVKQGDLIPEIDQKIFGSIKPRGVMGPIKSIYGYHVIEVLEFYPKDSYRGLDEVYDEISQHIFRLKSEILYLHLIDSLKAVHSIKINSDFSING